MPGRRDYAGNARISLRNIHRIENAGFGWLVVVNRRQAPFRRYSQTARPDQ